MNSQNKKNKAELSDFEHQPLVSIIMPAYNAEQFIEQAVDSILKQTYTNIELLICDDGSTDRTAEIIRSFSDTRIRKFFNEKNVGNLKTSNFLFGQCQGEFIGIQDADDWSTHDRIEMTMSRFAQNERLGIVGTNYIITTPNGTEQLCGVLPNSNVEIQKRMEKEVPPLLCASVIVKKTVADEVGCYRTYFDRKGFADFDWIYRICEISDAENLIKPCYFYRKHDTSFGHTHKGKNRYSGYEMHQILIEAHRQREKGLTDFIESSSHWQIRRFISKLEKQEGDRAVWANQQKLARKHYLSAFKLNPFDLHVLKSLGKIHFKLKA